MSWSVLRKKRDNVPPGTVETKIRDGQAVDSVTWPRKGVVYTRAGTLHIPMAVRTSDNRNRVGDCVVKYETVDPVKAMKWLGEFGNDYVLATSSMEGDLAYEAQAKIVPPLSKYNFDELPEKRIETEALARKEFGKAFARGGMRVYDIFTVWGERKEEIREDRLKPIVSELERLDRKAGHINEIEKKLNGLQEEVYAMKIAGRKEPETRETLIPEKAPENESPTPLAEALLEAGSDQEIRKLARDEAEKYVMLNPRYSMGGTNMTGQWIDTFASVFYNAMRGAKDGTY